MLHVYTVQDQQLITRQVKGNQELTEDIVWVDLLNPTPSEKQLLQNAYGQEVRNLEELVEIQASARFYQDQNGLHLNSYLLTRDNTGFYRNISLGFTVNNNRLFTLHADEFSELRQFVSWAKAQPELARNPISILIGLFEARVETMADTLESLHNDLETLSRSIFSGVEKDMGRILTRLAFNEDTNGKARLSLLDNRRVLTHLVKRPNTIDGDKSNRVQEILGDIESLVSHSEFLFDRIDFLMESALGAINIQQNKIIKLFSVAAVIFLPPTLIASVYGMNFAFMPELKWMMGYPLALLLMLISAIVPYQVFKKLGWI
jgi:magnesium transporter